MKGSEIAKEIENDKPKKVSSVNEWMSRQDIEKGFTIANAKFKHDYSRLWKALRKQSAYLYFIGVIMENYYVTKMMYSASRQAKFCGSVIYELGQKRVEKEHYHVFFKDVETIEKRLRTIERITEEDIHLTEYEPFFKAEIYSLEEINFDFEDLPAMAEKWNKSHQKEVKQHMKEIAPEIERHSKFLQRKADEKKAEKEAARKAKKEENDYIKEMRENRKRHRKDYERIERSFQKYYEGKA